MSFTVAIIVPPVPAKNAEAWATLDELLPRRGEGPRSPEFQELHDRLTARYPCYSALPRGRRDECVWTDGPLIDNFEHRAAVLGIRPSWVGEVVPFLVESANALGLVVFDDQRGKIYRPSRQRKKGPAKGPAAKGNRKRQGTAWNAHHFSTAVYESLAGILPKGFKLGAWGYRRALRGVRQTVHLQLSDYAPEFWFTLVFFFRVEAAEAIRQQFDKVSREDRKVTETCFVTLKTLVPSVGDKIVLNNRRSLRSALSGLMPALKRDVLPFLEAHQDLHSIDRLMNGSTREWFASHDLRSHSMNSVIVARLAGNPEWERLARAYRKLMKGKLSHVSADDLAIYERIVQHLENLA